MYDHDHLVDADLLRLRRSLLRHNNREDTILQRSAHSILVHTRGESERALEFADGALGDPVIVIRRRIGGRR